VPKAETHPNTFAWFVLIHRFSEVIRNSWTGAAPAKAAAKPAAAAKKEEPKKEEPKKEEPKKEEPKKEEPKKEEPKADDEMDLFGDDNEEDVVSISCYWYCGCVTFILNCPHLLLFLCARSI